MSELISFFWGVTDLKVLWILNGRKMIMAKFECFANEWLCRIFCRSPWMRLKINSNGNKWDHFILILLETWLVAFVYQELKLAFIKQEVWTSPKYFDLSSSYCSKLFRASTIYKVQWSLEWAAWQVGGTVIPIEDESYCTDMTSYINLAGEKFWHQRFFALS